MIEDLANGGTLSRRSVQICRTVLRAALSEAVDEGLIPRSPAARVGLPRTVAKPVVELDTSVWTEDEVDRFLTATAEHRWAIAFRLGVLYGLRHTAATHMVRNAADVGELRAIADLLGHSPEMLMNTYAHVLPNSQLAVVERLASRRVPS